MDVVVDGFLQFLSHIKMLMRRVEDYCPNAGALCTRIEGGLKLTVLCCSDE